MRVLRGLVLAAAALLVLHAASTLLAPLTAPLLALVFLVGLYVLLFRGPRGLG